MRRLLGSPRRYRWLYRPVRDFVPLGKVRQSGSLFRNPSLGCGFCFERMKACHSALIEDVHRSATPIIGTDSGIGGDDGKPTDNNFTLTGTKAVSNVDIGPGALMAVCLAENDRRFAGDDPRLLRPTTTLAIARLVCRFA